jgi:hypothetical protein
LTDKHDPNLLESVGFAITGILAGAGAMLASKKRGQAVAGQARNSGGDRIRTDIRELQDKALIMSKDIQAMQETLRVHAAATEQLKNEHDVVIAELFREIRNIGLSLREVATEVRMVIRQKGTE